ncbi:MAG TPA: DUF357 domain-containing protein [Methanocellales archaeon]|nr:DUF357 domain-containing protein [Methanocellales archaeon]
MLESKLSEEIEKWTCKLDEVLPTTKPRDDEGKSLIEDIQAYRKDSGYFLEKRDLIKSFECLIWAWALLEIGKRFEYLGESPDLD